MTTQQRRQVNHFGWLVTNFTERVPGVAHAVVMSVDGLLLTTSNRLPVNHARQLASLAAGILSLTQGASRCFDAGVVKRTVIEMEFGIMMIMSIRDGSCLAVLAAPDCEVGQVAYEMTMLVEQVGQMLTPELRAELQGAAESAATRQPV